MTGSLITDIARLRQVLDFEGLTMPGTKLTASDLDLIFDLKGRGWLLGEFKGRGARLKTGQRITMERLGNQLHGLRVAFVASHLVEPPEPVKAGAALVYQTRRNSEAWEIHHSDIPTVKELWDDTLREVGL